MQGASHQLLASAGLAGDQDSRGVSVPQILVPRDHLPDRVAKLLHGIAVADQLVETARPRIARLGSKSRACAAARRSVSLSRSRRSFDNDTGFVMKSYAPAFIASTASSTDAWPVIIRILIRGSTPWIKPMAFRPFKPGRLKSSRTTSGLKDSSSDNASSADHCRARLVAAIRKIDGNILGESRLVLHDQHRIAHLRAADRVSSTVVPTPGLLEMEIPPSMRSTIRFASGKPTPRPCDFVV